MSQVCYKATFSFIFVAATGAHSLLDASASDPAPWLSGLPTINEIQHEIEELGTYIHVQQLLRNNHTVCSSCGADPLLCATAADADFVHRYHAITHIVTLIHTIHIPRGFCGWRCPLQRRLFGLHRAAKGTGHSSRLRLRCYE